MSTLLDGTFGTDEMRAVFSDDAAIQRWLDVEASLARAEAEAGLIPDVAARAIAAACTLASIDREELRRGMDLVGYPIVALVTQIERACGSEAGGYVHWGATTQDIMDTATSLQLRAARRLLERDLRATVSLLEGLARTHAATPMVGRTHGQHAVPITFGYKLAVYVAELRRHLRRLMEVGTRAEFVEFAGAAGTLASIGAVGLLVQERMAQDLGLHVPPIAWHTSRDGVAEFVCVLGLISASLAKLAKEVALLQRNEIAELEEQHVSGRGGSSTMPQKRNPITCEAIIGASMHVRRLVPVQLDAMIHDGERATGPWHAEWLAVPQAAVLTHGIVRKTEELLRGLVIHSDRMSANLRLSGGLINAEAVMMALAPSVGRQRAHELVYAASMQAISSGCPFRDALLDNEVVARSLSVAAIDELLSPPNYLGLAATFVDRVLADQEPT